MKWAGCTRFWTRGPDGSIDPLSWHGGEAVNGSAWKWTLQKFKEVNGRGRQGDAATAPFTCEAHHPSE